MSTEREQRQASARAEEYAPKPTGGSLMAALSVGVVAFGVSFGVLGFYGHEVGEFPIVVGVIVAVAAVLAFVGYKLAARRHRRAYRQELANDDRPAGDRGDRG